VEAGFGVDLGRGDPLVPEELLHWSNGMPASSRIVATLARNRCGVTFLSIAACFAISLTSRCTYRGVYLSERLLSKT
jgi:hypothetical protein